jgi:hypothetical protein
MLKENLEGQTQKIKAIPPKAMVGKVRSTAIGVGSILTGFVVLIWFTPPIPVWSFAVFLGFGTFSMSKELVVEFLAFIPAAIRDVRAAIKGTNGRNSGGNSPPPG